MDCEHKIEKGRCTLCGKLAVKLSSTALGYSTCTLNFYRHVIEGYREKAPASRLVYGIAVHKFVDTMYKSLSEGEPTAYSRAVKKAKEAFSLTKTDDTRAMHLSDEKHMLNTCFGLWSGYIAEDSSFELIQIDGKPLTEVTFEIHFYEDEYIIVYLCGTIDKIGQFRGGCYAIGDWKTTSSWDNKGYFKQFELSRQLRMYRLACQLESERNTDSILGKIGATNMGVFIDAIFIKPNANENVIARSDVRQFGKDEIEEFRNGLLVWCASFSAKVGEYAMGHNFYKEGTINGSCEGKWGKCLFWNVCANSKEIGDILLARDFARVEFNPTDYNNLGD